MITFIAIDPTDPRPVYTQIIDEIRRAISIGTLRDNQPLPSVRALAADLHVNPNTVKQAYRDLILSGVATAKRGAGTFVAPGRKPAVDRGALLREVASRAARDARRHGISVSELANAMAEISSVSSG